MSKFVCFVLAFLFPLAIVGVLFMNATDEQPPVAKTAPVVKQHKPVTTVLIHVAGPKDNGYTASEDTAWCQSPSEELSYTSNEDGSGTIECSVPDSVLADWEYVGDYDGHPNCSALVGDTTIFRCSDGFTETS